MIEVMSGSGMYRYPSQKQYILSKSTNATQLSANILSIFFNKQTLANSNVRGGGSKYQQLNEKIIEAITSNIIFLLYKFIR